MDMDLSELRLRLLRRRRYGTPLPPGKMGEPWWWMPRSNRDAVRLLTSQGVLKRLGALVGGLIVLSLAWGFLHQPPPLASIGPVNQLSSAFGPITFRAPIGWLIAGGNNGLTGAPLVLFAPQADQTRAPVTISFLVVDVTPNYNQTMASPSPISAASVPSGTAGGASASSGAGSSSGATGAPSAGPQASTNNNLLYNPRTLLDTIIASYLPSAGRGPYCTTDLTYGVAVGQTNVLPPATQITWLETRPLGYTVVPGSTTDVGACGKNSTPKVVHGPFPTYSPAPSLSPLPSPSLSPTAAASDSVSAAPAPASGKPATEPGKTPATSPSPPPLAAPSPTAKATVYVPNPSAGATVNVPNSSAAASAAASASAASAASAEGTPMVAIQWFAMPNSGVFHTQTSRSMLVVTLMYPANLSKQDITNILTVYDTVVGSITPS